MYITPNRLQDLLSIRDLTDPEHGEHAMQHIIAAIQRELESAWNTHVVTCRGEAVVTVEQNYDILGYPADGAAREARYTHCIDASHILRTQMSAVVTDGLRCNSGLIATHPQVTLLAPGMVYRRDVVDRHHVGQPHQLDIWHVADEMTEAHLMQLIELVVHAILPGAEWRTEETAHPYTTHGKEIQVRTADGWIELGECGLAAEHVLSAAGVRRDGLAMGIGLDRALMLRKDIDDIRILRSDDSRIASQMQDLMPYRSVSSQPAAVRDISVARGDADLEVMGDRLAELLSPEELDCVEDMSLLSVTPYEQLPQPARSRLGIMPGQVNALLRITLRHVGRSIPRSEANHVRSKIYDALHEGEHPGYNLTLI